MVDWDAIREDFPILKSKVFLDTAYHCPYFTLWDEGYRSFVGFHGRRREVGGDKDDFEPVRQDEVVAVCQKKVADLIQAKPEEILFLSNTSEGLNLVAHMIDWKEGDEILLNDGEFPSNVYPWRNLQKRGVTIKVVPTEEGAVSVESYARAISERTRLIPITHVNWITGYKHDLGALSNLAKEVGAWVIADAIQSLGATRVRSEDLDFMSSGTYKWLLSPVGLSVFYMKESLSHLHDPPILGFDCMTSSGEPFGPFQFKTGPQKFQYATKNLPGIHMLNHSLDYLNRIGFQNICARILELGTNLIEGLRTLGIRILTYRDEAKRAGIVSFDTERPKELVHALARRGILVNVRGKYVRVSPNFYNSLEDIDTLLNALEDILKR